MSSDTDEQSVEAVLEQLRKYPAPEEEMTQAASGYTLWSMCEPGDKSNPSQLVVWNRPGTSNDWRSVQIYTPVGVSNADDTVRHNTRFHRVRLCALPTRDGWGSVISFGQKVFLGPNYNYLFKFMLFSLPLIVEKLPEAHDEPILRIDLYSPSLNHVFAAETYTPRSWGFEANKVWQTKVLKTGKLTRAVPDMDMRIYCRSTHLPIASGFCLIICDREEP